MILSYMKVRFSMQQDNIITVPNWWPRRDSLTRGSAWTKYNDPKTHPGVRTWICQWFEKEIYRSKSIDDVISLSNSLRYFAPCLLDGLKPVIYRQVQRLYSQGDRVGYCTRTLEILLPAMVDLRIVYFVINQ